MTATEKVSVEKVQKLGQTIVLLLTDADTTQEEKEAAISIAATLVHHLSVTHQKKGAHK